VPPTSTPASGCFNVESPIDDDVGIGCGPIPAPTIRDMSITDGPAPGVVVYPHGFKIRFKTLLALLVEDLLTRAGCTEEDYRIIRRKDGSTRYVIRGSVALGQRKPRKKGQKEWPLVRLNRRWKTILYGIEFEVREGMVTVNLQGVRIEDCDRFFRTVLGLAAEDYEVVHVRHAERYVVLSPREARTLAQSLGAPGDYFRVRGPEIGKTFLLRGYAVPVEVRTRSQATALVSMYRVGPGATTAIKLEVRLAGKSNQRRQFTYADVSKLDNILLNLVPEARTWKPALWEPRNPDAPVERHRDSALARVRLSGRQGRPPPAELRRIVAANCNNIDGSSEGISLEESLVYPAPVRIRENRPLLAPSLDPSIASALSTASHGFVPVESFDPFKVQLYIREGEEVPRLPRRRSPFQGGPLRALVEGALPGHLTEVVFPQERDPCDFIKMVVSSFPEDVGVLVLDHGGNARLPVARLGREHPVTDTTKVLVVALDASLAYLIAGCFSRMDQMGGMRSGPLIPKIEWWRRTCNMPHVWKGVSGLLAGHLERLRDLCEADGLRCILVTEDARPERGRGPWQASHRCRDTRVRSSAGDAARYACHLRLLAESDHRGTITSIVAIKDHVEGITGRVLFTR